MSSETELYPGLVNRMVGVRPLMLSCRYYWVISVFGGIGGVTEEADTIECGWAVVAFNLESKHINKSEHNLNHWIFHRTFCEDRPVTASLGGRKT